MPWYLKMAFTVCFSLHCMELETLALVSHWLYEAESKMRFCHFTLKLIRVTLMPSLTHKTLGHTQSHKQSRGEAGRAGLRWVYCVWTGGCSYRRTSTAMENPPAVHGLGSDWVRMCSQCTSQVWQVDLWILCSRMCSITNTRTHICVHREQNNLYLLIRVFENASGCGDNERNTCVVKWCHTIILQNIIHLNKI